MALSTVMIKLLIISFFGTDSSILSLYLAPEQNKIPVLTISTGILLYPPSGNYPSQHLPDVPFHFVGPVIFIPAMEEGRTPTLVMTAQSRDISLRPETACHVRFPLHMPGQRQQQRTHIYIVHITQILILTVEIPSVKGRTARIIPAFATMTVRTFDMQPFIQTMIRHVAVVLHLFLSTPVVSLLHQFIHVSYREPSRHLEEPSRLPYRLRCVHRPVYQKKFITSLPHLLSESLRTQIMIFYGYDARV